VGAKEIQAIVKLVILKILSNIKGPQEMIKKNMLLEPLEEAGLVDINLSCAA
jgi:hypothetical protein